MRQRVSFRCFLRQLLVWLVSRFVGRLRICSTINTAYLALFLVACTQLCNPLCRLVGPSVTLLFRRFRVVFGQRPRRGRSPVEHWENLSVRTSVPPPSPILRALSPLGPKSKLYGPNPNKMVQIRPKLAKSWQNGLGPGKMGLIWLENLNSGLSYFILAP